MGAIGSLQSFFGSLDTGAGGPVSHYAMQKLIWTFCLVAYDTLKHCLQCLVARSKPFHATLTLFGCNTGQRSGNLFLQEVNIPST
jgi:hypothetical protein